MTTTHYRILAVLWTIGIGVAYTIPAPTVPVSTSVIGWDKLAHFALFGGFGLLWMHAVHPRRSAPRKMTSRRWVLIVFGVGAALSILGEVYQGTLPHRTLELYDALANILGLTAALLFFRWRYPPVPQPSKTDAPSP